MERNNKQAILENRARPFGITRMELKIIEGLSNGLRWIDIANEHGIKRHTVHVHLCKIKDKMGVSRTIEVVVLAMKSGLIKL